MDCVLELLMERLSLRRLIFATCLLGLVRLSLRSLLITVMLGLVRAGLRIVLTVRGFVLGSSLLFLISGGRFFGLGIFSRGRILGFFSLACFCFS